MNHSRLVFIFCNLSSLVLFSRGYAPAIFWLYMEQSFWAPLMWGMVIFMQPFSSGLFSSGFALATCWLCKGLSFWCIFRPCGSNPFSFVLADNTTCALDPCFTNRHSTCYEWCRVHAWQTIFALLILCCLLYGARFCGSLVCFVCLMSWLGLSMCLH